MYIKIKKDTTVISLETLLIDISDDELLIEITDDQFFEFQRFMRDFNCEYLFDSKSNQISIFKYEKALVKFINTQEGFGTIENYDFRQEGILYYKISEDNQEYITWLFIKEKPNIILNYLNIISNETAVCIEKEGVNCFFNAKDGLALLQSTFAQNENNDDFILDFDPSLISDNTMKTVKHIAFPNDDGEWRSIYKTLVEQSSINTEVEYQWIKSFNKALETCTSDEDLLKAFNDSKPSIFTRIKAIDDGLVSSAVHV